MSASSKGTINFGYAVRTIRTAGFSGRLPIRVSAVSVGLFALAILLSLVSITLGDYRISLDRVIGIVLGGGEGTGRMIVLQWRLPIAMAAVVLGALLGVGGAIFQSLTRNPLGSPDIIGFSAGSYTAVVIAMLILGVRGYWQVAGAAIIGGLLTAVAVYLLAYRGGIQGFRLIIVGIGISAMLGSLNAYLITRADIDEAMSVGFWGAGSLHRIGWSSMKPTLVMALLIGLACLVLGRELRRLELGDDAAITQGARPGLSRLALIITGVATVALVTAIAGPIGFIALVAPQLARRLTRSPGVSLIAAAAMGAVLLSAAHLLGLIIQSTYRPIPVGLITVCLGGIYLIWLLIREARTRYGVNR